MKGKKRKILTVVIVTLLISTFLASTVYAAWVDKKITAYYRNVKIKNNGKLVNIESGYEPFIIHVDGDPKKASTFVPVRALSEILGKEIKWDQATYTVDVIDKDDPEVAKLITQLLEKDVEIKALEAKNKDLEAKIKELEKGDVSKKDLESTEKYLSRHYDYHKDIDFDIRLHDVKGEIELDILVDLDRDYLKWDKLKDSEKEDYIRDLVKEIEYDFKGVKIFGQIEDKRTRDILVDFYQDARGRLIVNTGLASGSIRDLDDMEYYLNREFAKEYKWEGYLDFEISISRISTESRIELNVDVDKKKWEKLFKGDKEWFLEDVYKAIKKEFPRADIYGNIYYYGAYSSDYSFDYDSKGNVRIN